MKTVAVEHLLAQHPLMQHMTEAEREGVARRGTRIYLDRGEVLYEAGGSASEVFLVLAGAIQVEYPQAHQTRGFVAVMIRAPGFLGEAQVLHGECWSGTGVAMFPVTALGLNLALLEHLLFSHPRLAVAFYRELSWRFLGAINAWKYQQLAKPGEALARYLLSYSAISRELNPAGMESVDVSQAEMARATGVRRETINRLLRGWERTGNVRLSSQGVELIEPEKLQQLLPDQDNPLLVRRIDARRLEPVSILPNEQIRAE
jgi:CRP-like cAMP-binding protein